MQVSINLTVKVVLLCVVNVCLGYLKGLTILLKKKTRVLFFVLEHQTKRPQTKQHWVFCFFFKQQHTKMNKAYLEKFGALEDLSRNLLSDRLFLEQSWLCFISFLLK